MTADASSGKAPPTSKVDPTAKLDRTRKADRPPDPTDVVPPERATPALLMSLILHVVLLTTIGLFWSTRPHGTGEAEDRPIGIALVHRMPDRDRYVDAKEMAEADQAAEEATASSASAAAPPADLTPPLDLDGVLQAMQATPAPVAGTGLAGDTNLGSDAFGSGRAGGSDSQGDDKTTMLFGISGSGSRFVYVFDRSDSMNGFGGKPLRAAKNELIRSLKTMTDRQRFQIIFYNDKPTPFKLGGVPLQMVSGDPGYVRLAESYVRSITAYGGTEHEAALKMALRMAPDVIFFLTDASIPRLSGSEMREIKSRAERVGSTIHCIEFGAQAVPSPDTFLRDLAAQNHGEYRFVDVRSLEVSPPIREAQSDSEQVESQP